jgi:glycosyltransferase involved in cell wall biosynthesis
MMPLCCGFLQPRHEILRAVESSKLSLFDLLVRNRAGRDTTTVYLTILNPEDFRKNIDPLLRAFTYFSRQNPDAFLLVKVLTSSARYSLGEVIADVLPNKMDSGTAIECSNIWFFNDYLNDQSMTSLYQLSDFYLCASICEGQNLPLLEAMALGCVPITTRNTAMLDYINSENAIIVESREVNNDIRHLAGAVADRAFTISKSDVQDILNALVTSADMSEQEYMEKSTLARSAVKEQFSPETVMRRVRKRLEFIEAPARAKAIEWNY